MRFAKHYLSTPLTLVLVLAATMSSAGLIVERQRETTVKPLLADVDGVWIAQDAILLVSARADHATVSGKDQASAWSVVCVIEAETLHCRGTGTERQGKSFFLASTIKHTARGLEESWIAHGGTQPRSGTTLFYRFVPEMQEKDTRPIRTR